MAYDTHPCDDGVVRGAKQNKTDAGSAKPWILAATILGSSMAQINSSTVNVALPALQESLGANVVDIQWVVNAYTLFLAALILLGGSLGDHLGAQAHLYGGRGAFRRARPCGAGSRRA